MCDPRVRGSFLSSASEVINKFLFSPLKSEFRGFTETRSRSEIATTPTYVALYSVLYLDRECSVCGISRSIAGVSVRSTLLSGKSVRGKLALSQPGLIGTVPSEFQLAPSRYFEMERLFSRQTNFGIVPKFGMLILQIEITRWFLEKMSRACLIILSAGCDCDIYLIIAHILKHFERGLNLRYSVNHIGRPRNPLVRK